jgi:beta-ureidopropionase / N-carbamoyl-L-amino-acid hydrolase
MDMEIRADSDFGFDFLSRLGEQTADAPGVTRVAYGAGENAAHNLLGDAASKLDLQSSQDFSGNTYVTLPGRDPSAPHILIGSHLDSVPHGGNFDGAAGVAAGLAVLAGFRRSDYVPHRTVTVMGIRAEESCWFPASYIGSRMALGRLQPHEVDQLRRSDTGRSLADHMRDLGLDPDSVRKGRAAIQRAQVACYIEPHIEQGPVLDTEKFPVAIVEAITGGPRFREGRIFGEYAHAGAAPRGYRRDAVAALGDFIAGVNEFWADLERRGNYCLFTFGIVETDPSRHTFSRVPGEVHFCLDTRGIREEVLTEIRLGLAEVIQKIEHKHGVRFELGNDSGPSIATMDAEVRQRLAAAADICGIKYRHMASGAGHDAAAFAKAGIPTGMLFIRNQNGSHNPKEDMQLSDFRLACDVLMNFVVAFKTDGGKT